MSLLQTSIKLSISVIIIFYIAISLDFLLIAEIIKNVDILMIIMACGAFAFIPIVQTFRWKFILDVFSRFITVETAFRTTMIGIFFSNFLPSIGGDFIKASLTAINLKRSWSVCFASIVIEKILGFIALMALLVPSYFMWDASSFWNIALTLGIFDQAPATNHFAAFPLDIWIVFSIIMVFFCLLWIYKRKVFAPIMRSELFGEIVSARFLSLAFFGVCSSAILTQIFQTLTYYFVALALDINIGLAALIFFSQLVSFTIYLPISFGGWGVREFVLVSAATALAVSEEKLFLLGVLSGVIPLALSMPGLFFWNTTNLELSGDWVSRFQIFGKNKRLK